MSQRSLRAVAGLALALLLAAVASPALGSDDADDTVRAAAASTAQVVGPVDEAASSPVSILGELTERIAADVAAAEQAAALERYAAAVEAAEIERYVAAVEAAQLERYVAAVEAAQLERYVAAVEADRARRAAAPRTAAAPAPAPAPAGSVEGIIQRHFGEATSAAIRVARCESGLNPRAVSPGGGNHGLFQINNVHRGTFESVTGQPWSAVYDAEANTRFARWLYGQQGWGPWACA